MSRINIIALAVFIAVVVWVFTWGNDTVEGVQKGAANVKGTATKTKHAIQKTTSNLVTPDTPRPELEKRVRKMEEENKQLRFENQALERLYDENARLRQALTLQKIPSFELVAAEVIGRETNTWYHTIEIDKGTEHGVNKDDPVVMDTGLVGKISLVGDKTATVLLVTDEACKVTARVTGSSQRGIVQGQGARRAEVMVAQGDIVGERGGINSQPMLRLRWLDKTAPVQEGMSVITSGQGLVFPPNLDLGVIKSVQRGEINTEAEVEPHVDFSSLDFVFVITGTK